MSTTVLTKTVRTLVAAGTTNAAAATTRGTVDLRTAQGGLLTFKVTNGGTGPTVACSVNVLVAHSAGATPTAAAAGVDWKTLYQVAHSTTASAVGEWNIDVPPGAMHLEVEFTANTVQGVTVEAFLSEITNAVTT
jgi:Ca2+-binding RTX toxin-like protein